MTFELVARLAVYLFSLAVASYSPPRHESGVDLLIELSPRN